MAGATATDSFQAAAVDAEATELWWKCGLCNYEIRLPIQRAFWVCNHARKRINHCMRVHGFRPEPMPKHDLVNVFRRNTARRAAAECSFQAMAARMAKLKWVGLHQFAGNRRWIKAKTQTGGALVDDCKFCQQTFEFSTVARTVCWQHPAFKGVEESQRKQWFRQKGRCEPPLRERGKILARMRKEHKPARKRYVIASEARLATWAQREAASGQRKRRRDEEEEGAAGGSPSWG